MTKLAQETASETVSELPLPAQTAELGIARRYAEDAAAAFGLDAEASYDFTYAVNEAVTNAIRHGAPDEHGQIRLSAVIDDQRLTLSVRDYGTFKLPIPDHSISSDHGRGLALMASLTDEVELFLEPGSTVVQLSKKRGD